MLYWVIKWIVWARALWLAERYLKAWWNLSICFRTTSSNLHVCHAIGYIFRAEVLMEHWEREQASHNSRFNIWPKTDFIVASLCLTFKTAKNTFFFLSITNTKKISKHIIECVVCSSFPPNATFFFQQSLWLSVEQSLVNATVPNQNQTYEPQHVGLEETFSSSYSIQHQWNENEPRTLFLSISLSYFKKRNM